MVWRAKWDIDNSWIATEHFRKTNHEALLKAFLWFPVFQFSIVLLNPLHQCHKLFYLHWTPSLHIELWEISSSQIAVAMWIVWDIYCSRNPLEKKNNAPALNTSVTRYTTPATSTLCHWLMCKNKPPQNKFYVWFLTLASSFQDHAWPLQSLLKLFDVLAKASFR